jgi:hypothetical protein
MQFRTRPARWFAAGLTAVALTASAGVLAGPASAVPATVFADTAVQAVASLTSPANCGGIEVVGNDTSTLHYDVTGPPGGSLLGSSLATLTGNPLSALVTAASVEVGGTLPGTSALTLTFHSAFCGRSVTVGPITVTDLAGIVTTAALPITTTLTDSIVLNHPVNDNADGTTGVSATSPLLVATVAVGNLPAGLSGGTEATITPGSAPPGTYNYVTEVATDGSGALAFSEFTLKVIGHAVVTSGAYGDNVNGFGNGWDSYQQHDYAGAVIVGWTATQDDPATHFLELGSGPYRFEYAPAGSGSGLCVSDPDGGWASDPLPNGLILTPCNTGNFQLFTHNADGTYTDVATGLTVWPDGTGAQLRGQATTTPGVDPHYTWTPFASLPV